jgi:hypothetical protein
MISFRARQTGVVAAVLFVLAITVGGCAPNPDAQPEPSFCDGISSAVGGCDPDRPTFAGTSCEAIAHEFGEQLDRRLVAIHGGPEDPEASKAVRAQHFTTVAASLANNHIREIGLIKECSAEPFVAEAETRFSADLRDHAGELLADGDPVPYDQWRDELLDLMALIDLEEDGPGT